MGGGSDEKARRPDGEDIPDPPADDREAVSEVRIEYAKSPGPGAGIVLVPPEAEYDDEDDEPPSEPERYLDPKPPRRAADALPPRARRSAIPADLPDEVTTPRGQRLEAPEDPGADDTGKPPSTPRPSLAEPLFTQEWGTTPAGSPTWRPGAPPVDPRPDGDPWWIGGVIALIAAGAIVLWLALYYA